MTQSDRTAILELAGTVASARPDTRHEDMQHAAQVIRDQLREITRLRAELTVAREVKELVWEERDGYRWVADGAGTLYFITEYRGMTVPFYLDGPHMRREFPTLQAAKDAAQADYAARIRAALVSSFAPTHKHLKRGTEYQVIGAGSLQANEPLSDDSDLIIYRDAEGRLWARPPAEFNDGRFAALKGGG